MEELIRCTFFLLRSTNLDQWSWPQLRLMKVAGNASFSDWLTRHPGSYSPSTSDVKSKYTSKAAALYKEELARRVKEDEARFGKGRVILEGVAAPVEAKKEQEGKDDFFDSWDKPTLVKPAPKPAPVSTPPIVSLGLGGTGLTPNGSRSTTPNPGSAVGSGASTPAISSNPTSPTIPAQPRTVSSSSLRTAGSSTSTTPRASKLGAQRTTGTGAGVGKAKLGAKKAGGTINFEEAERKAREEEERIKKLGYDSKREADEAAAAAAAASAAAASAAAARQSSTSGAPASASRNGQGHAKKDSIDAERLGMGMRRLGFGQVAGVSGEQAAREAEQARKAAERKAKGYGEEEFQDSGEAVSRFGTQKGKSLISLSCRSGVLRD